MSKGKQRRGGYGRTYLREWRQYRDLSQERAAERLDLSQGQLSRIERGEMPYSRGLLEAAAQAYMCAPCDLLDVNPIVESEVIDMVDRFRKADPDEQKDALDFIEFRRNQQKNTG